MVGGSRARRPGVVTAILLVLCSAVVLLVRPAALAGPGGQAATARGRGGAAATADARATRAAMDIMARGGNAVDGAVAAAAMLGVTKPFWCGIGGGGFMVIYLARSRRVVTIDHNGAAPQAVTPGQFLGPDARPLPLADRITGGIAAAVPGAVLGWEEALRRYGRLSLAEVLAPAARAAADGFARDAEFVALTRANLRRFRAVDASRRLFLTPAGGVPALGSRFTNPDLAAAYRLIARDGSRALYRGPIGWALVRTAAAAPRPTGDGPVVRPGVMTLADLADYTIRILPPVAAEYRGEAVYGMGLPSAGGTAIALALHILAGDDLKALPRPQALHLMLETARLVYADRRAYLGDPVYAHPPLAGLLSPGYAAAERARIGPSAAPGTVRPGDPFGFQPGARRSQADADVPAAEAADMAEGASTTHLTVADREGNVVSYTYTLGQGGGNAEVVSGFGFLLNTDLANFDPVPGHPNSPAGGKQPLSTMSPTIVLRAGRPVLALGSPGGGTIVTTVLETLLDVIDFGMDLPSAIAAPRVFQDSTPLARAEPGFLESQDAAALAALGHRFAPAGPAGLGAVAGIAFLDDGRVEAAAEPARRGGGSAAVERP